MNSMILGTFTRNWRDRQAGDTVNLSHETCVYDEQTIKALVARGILAAKDVNLKPKKVKQAKE